MTKNLSLVMFSVVAITLMPVVSYGDAFQDPDKGMVTLEQHKLNILEGKVRCEKHTNMSKRLRCLSDHSRALKKAGQSRGTHQYAQKHYVPMETPRLLEVYHALHEEYADQEHIYAEYGELSNEGFGTEIGEVDEELHRRGAHPYAVYNRSGRVLYYDKNRDKNKNIN